MDNHEEKFFVTKRAGILGMARKCIFINNKSKYWFFMQKPSNDCR